MPNTKQTMKLICRDRGYEKSYGKCFCEISEKLDLLLTKPYRDMLLRGFLLDPKTLKAWFRREAVKTLSIKQVPDLTIIQSDWQFHATLMTDYSLEEILEYYSQYKEDFDKGLYDGRG